MRSVYKCDALYMNIINVITLYTSLKKKKEFFFLSVYTSFHIHTCMYMHTKVYCSTYNLWSNSKCQIHMYIHIQLYILYKQKYNIVLK